MLELEGGEGVKSVVKMQKREPNRGVENRYWHLRPVTERLGANEVLYNPDTRSEFVIQGYVQLLHM